MVVRISGGPFAKIDTPLMVSKNVNCSCTISGVPDDAPGISYRSSPKGWMDTMVMPQWFLEKSNQPLFRKPLRHYYCIDLNTSKRPKAHSYMDNCSGHKETPELASALHYTNTEIRYFEPNLTDYMQPCDSSVIQKIKSELSVIWEKYKMDMMKANNLSKSSGKIPNHGKYYFLKLARKAVDRVNRQRDIDSLSHAQRAMIRAGMALNVNGR